MRAWTDALEDWATPLSETFLYAGVTRIHQLQLLWAEGEWDLVLCHFVLHYRPAGAGDVRRLAAAVRPGGRLSVMVPNPASMVLRQLVTGGPEAALIELHADTKHAVTVAHDVRKVPMPDL